MLKRRREDTTPWPCKRHDVALSLASAGLLPGNLQLGDASVPPDEPSRQRDISQDAPKVSSVLPSLMQACVREGVIDNVRHVKDPPSKEVEPPPSQSPKGIDSRQERNSLLAKAGPQTSRSCTTQHHLPGPLQAILQNKKGVSSSSTSDRERSILRSLFPSNNSSIMSIACLSISIFGICCWFLLRAIIYKISPRENLISLGKTESYCAIAAGAILLGRTFAKVTTLLNEHGPKILSSGVLVAGFVVHVIAATTTLSMVFVETPVLYHPITRAKIYPLRWCEFTILAFIIIFLSEGLRIPLEQVSQPSGYTARVQHAWKLLKWPILIGLSQSLANLAGLFSPFTRDFTVQVILIVCALALFSLIFPFIYYRRKAFLNMKKGTNVNEIETYNRARLSYKSLLVFASCWSVLFGFYCVGSNILIHPTLPFVLDCIIEVVSTGFLMDVISEAHKYMFDDSERTSTSLDELRRLMNVVWESSSDVISISVKGPNGIITTMLSPTFHHIDDLFVRIMLEKEGVDEKSKEAKITKLKAKPVCFETTLSRDTKDNTPSQSGSSSLGSVFSVNMAQGGQADYMYSDVSPETNPSLFSIQQLVIKTWECPQKKILSVHDINMRNGDVIHCEAKATRLGAHALIVVIRDISERFICFEAEKKAVSELTARRKDAEANRFTRHEVKNGLLATIGISDQLRDVFTNNREEIFSRIGKLASNSARDQQRAFRYMGDLDTTLRDILDTILAEAMARDVIHEVYEPKIERSDIMPILSSIQGKENANRFPVITNPSPLPLFFFDLQLLKYVHCNAVSNSIKYGKKGGVVITEVNFDSTKSELEINVINFPGEGHANLVKLGNQATEAVFEQGKRLHSNVDLFGGQGQVNHSSGDGAWISRKCAKTLGGDCGILFESEKTIFTLKCPARPCGSVLKKSPGIIYDPANFQLPIGTWGVAIDDSKVQRKLMQRFFSVAGIPESRQVILGGNVNEIRCFNDIAEKALRDHPSSFVLVIADENLDVTEDDHKCYTISGSLCIQKLRHQLEPKLEQRMLALVRSANDSASDVAIYNSRAHGFICKAPIQRGKIMEILAPFWSRRFAKRFPESIAGGNEC